MNHISFWLALTSLMERGFANSIHSGRKQHLYRKVEYCDDGIVKSFVPVLLLVSAFILLSGCNLFPSTQIARPSVVTVAPSSGTGDLTFVACARDGSGTPAPACLLGRGLKSPQALAVSADGKSVYVAARGRFVGPGQPTLSVLDRDPATGLTRFAACFGNDTGCTPVRGLDSSGGPFLDVIVSKDGTSVYVSTGGHRRFDRRV